MDHARVGRARIVVDRSHQDPITEESDGVRQIASQRLTEGRGSAQPTQCPGGGFYPVERDGPATQPALADVASAVAIEVIEHVTRHHGRPDVSEPAHRQTLSAADAQVVVAGARRGDQPRRLDHFGQPVLARHHLVQRVGPVGVGRGPLFAVVPQAVEIAVEEDGPPRQTNFAAILDAVAVGVLEDQPADGSQTVIAEVHVVERLSVGQVDFPSAGQRCGGQPTERFLLAHGVGAGRQEVELVAAQLIRHGGRLIVQQTVVVEVEIDGPTFQAHLMRVADALVGGVGEDGSRDGGGPLVGEHELRGVLAVGERYGVHTGSVGQGLRVAAGEQLANAVGSVDKTVELEIAVHVGGHELRARVEQVGLGLAGPGPLRVLSDQHTAAVGGQRTAESSPLGRMLAGVGLQDFAGGPVEQKRLAGPEFAGAFVLRADQDVIAHSHGRRAEVTQARIGHFERLQQFARFAVEQVGRRVVVTQRRADQHLAADPVSGNHRHRCAELAFALGLGVEERVQQFARDRIELIHARAVEVPRRADQDRVAQGRHVAPELVGRVGAGVGQRVEQVAGGHVVEIGGPVLGQVAILALRRADEKFVAHHRDRGAELNPVLHLGTGKRAKQLTRVAVEQIDGTRIPTPLAGRGDQHVVAVGHHRGAEPVEGVSRRIDKAADVLARFAIV